MNTTRRKLMSSAALAPVMFVTGGMASGAVVSCNQSGQIVVDPAVLNAIQQAVATGCNFIPAVTTIVALVAASFPAVAGATTIAESVLSQISALLCASAPNPASAKATLVPNTSVPVNGWVIGPNGKLVYV